MKRFGRDSNERPVEAELGTCRSAAKIVSYAMARTRAMNCACVVSVYFYRLHYGIQWSSGFPYQFYTPGHPPDHRLQGQGSYPQSGIRVDPGPEEY